jgi:DNA repair protein RadC
MLIEIKEKSKQVPDVEAAAEIFKSILSAESEVDHDKEHFWVIGLNSKNIVLYVELVALGTLNNSLVHPREIYRMAIMKIAAQIIIGHNHPSGCAEASHEDRLITDRLRIAGEILGIKLLDHIVIGNNKPGCFSFHRKSFLGEDLKGSLNQIQIEKGGMEMEKVMESDIKVKGDILDQIEDKRGKAISNVYDLKTLAEISITTTLEDNQSKKTDWICIFNLFRRSLDAIEKSLEEMDELITGYRHKSKEASF